jgi:hypothetical protein
MSQSSCFDNLVALGFSKTNLAPYGDVLVIPAKDFQSGWETNLRAEGHAIYSQTYGGGMAFLVSLNVKDSRKVPSKSDQKKPDQISWHKWSPEDVERLMKRMGEVKGSPKKRARQLLKEFPGRVVGALANKYVKTLAQQEATMAPSAHSDPASAPTVAPRKAEEFDDEMVRALKTDLLDIAQELPDPDCKTVIRTLRYISFLEKKTDG